MPFRDRYTNFTFNDVSSETMKVWVTNAKDIKFEATPKFSDTFISPVASQVRYHTGTTLSNQDFQLKCIAIGVNMLDWRAIQNWLSPLQKGKLQFDFNDKTYYNVKVSQAISGTVFIKGNGNAYQGDVYNIEFTVSFTTTSDWAALGPEVVVPMNTKYTEHLPLTMTIYEAPESFSLTNAQVTFVEPYSYNYITQNQAMWDTPSWWISGLGTTATDLSVKAQLSGSNSAKMCEVLQTALHTHNITTVSATINNKFQFPIFYNKTRHLEILKPCTSEVTYNRDNTRRYLTQPTVLNNKAIHLDEELYAKMQEKGMSLQNYNYILVDSGVIGGSNYADCSTHGVAYIYEKTSTVEGTQIKQVVMDRYGATDEYGLHNIVLDDTGITLYGLSLMFLASSEEAYQNCPLYYIENEETSAVFNAGSYEAYPNIFVDLGTGTSMQLYKNGELLYDYLMTIRNTTLNVNGRSGYVTFNNMLAESASVVGSGGKSKIVSESVNNGPLIIPSGNPELLKVRFFGKVEGSLAAYENFRGIGDLKLTHFFFQPVGEFKYSRNGNFGVALFESVQTETPYNKGFYPMIGALTVDHQPYGSRLNNYLFSVNSFISRCHLDNGIDIWVLTIPNADLGNCSLKDMAVNATGAFIEPKYMYLSLCDYTDISLVTEDGSAVSYLGLQTRDIC